VIPSRGRMLSTYATWSSHLILSCRQRAHACVSPWIAAQVGTLPPASRGLDVGGVVLGRKVLAWAGDGRKGLGFCAHVCRGVGLCN